jgi:hypothetical protein
MEGKGGILQIAIRQVKLEQVPKAIRCYEIIASAEKPKEPAPAQGKDVGPPEATP